MRKAFLLDTKIPSTMNDDTKRDDFWGVWHFVRGAAISTPKYAKDCVCMARGHE